MIEVLLEQDVPWASTTVWQVDERVAPDGHGDRNANQLSALPCRVRLMPVTSIDLRRAARRYGDRLPARFDVVHLGMGDDGHTASWPPGDDRPIRSVRDVEVIDEFNGRARMTLTRRVVNDARSRAVLTGGSAKRAMVERWMLQDRSLPIAALRSQGTWVFIDDAAAPNSFPATR